MHRGTVWLNGWKWVTFGDLCKVWGYNKDETLHNVLNVLKRYVCRVFNLCYRGDECQEKARKKTSLDKYKENQRKLWVKFCQSSPKPTDEEKAHGWDQATSDTQLVFCQPQMFSTWWLNVFWNWLGLSRRQKRQVSLSLCVSLKSFTHTSLHLWSGDCDSVKLEEQEVSLASSDVWSSMTGCKDFLGSFWMLTVLSALLMTICN